MACERVDISILVVDDDETSLTIVSNVLISWEYKVLTANSARNALETLREFEGFFDLVITELHISGIDGFEFQKRVKDEFQLPVIMMSADRRKSVMSKSLENGAALYILKPICANDFKDIWKYAIAARKEKIFIENELRRRERESPCENIISHDVAISSLTEPKRKRKYSKRKRTQTNKEESSSPIPKKPKIVWTTYLHNLFLLAIKQIGFDRAVPKKILEIMNVPNLTRENIASHLQKYRIFLRKVAERGIIEGLSERTLRSRFASGVSALMIKEIQTRTEKLCVPVQQYLKRLAHQKGIRGIVNDLHDKQVSSNAYMTNQLGRGQSSYPLHNGLMLHNQPVDSLSQVRLGQSIFGSNIGTNNVQPKMLGCYANPPYQANSSFNNAGAMFPTYGMGHCMTTSTNGLTRRGLRYGDQMYQNYDSLGTNKFSYGLGNCNMGSLSTSNLPSTCTSYPSSNSSVVQLNGGSKTVGTGNNDSFGLINETQNANMDVAILGNVNFGLVQRGLASTSDSNVGNGFISALPTTLMTNGTREENIPGISQLPQQLDDNVVENEHKYNATSICEIISSQLEDDLSELFLMVDDMQLLNNETEENPNASEFLNSDFSSSSQVVQSFEQSNSRAGDDVIVLPTKDTLNFPNESSTSSDKNSNQMQGNGESGDWEHFDRFLVDNVSSASNSTSEQDWDMDIIEALFGTEVN